jgi:hypothetical protein
MIYVIKSLAFVDPDKDFTIGNIRTAIKIGYANNTDDRLRSYDTHNLAYKVLFIIDEGTQKDEHKLHLYFKDLKVKYAREWFWEDENCTIESFFKLHKDIDTIRSVIDIVRTTRSLDKDSIKLANLRLNKIFEIKFKTKEEFLDNLKPLETLKSELSDYSFENPEDFYCWISKRLDISDIDTNQIEQSLLIPDNYKDEVNRFFSEFYKFKYLYSKLKYYCENQFSCNEVKNIVYSQIAEKHFHECLNILGEERLKSIGYNVTLINKDLNIMSFNKTDLVNTIYNSFEVNKRYSLAFIKDTLRDIYNGFSYEKSPKASDLKEYFNLAEAKVKEDDKLVNGFEIRSIKL